MVAGLYGGRWPCHTGRRPSHHEIWLFVSSLCLHPRKIRHQPSPRQLLFSLPPMMEVDMQSPPTTFRSVAFTIKRPRSPGSPTQERQTVRAWQLFLRVCSLRLLQKRLSLAPVGLEGQCVRRAPTAPDGVDGRAASQDDWVRQARELSIASPLSVTVGFPPAMNGSGTVAQSRVDEHMVSPLSGIRRWCSQTMLKTMLCNRLLITRSRKCFVYMYIRVAHDRGRRQEVICLRYISRQLPHRHPCPHRMDSMRCRPRRLACSPGHPRPRPSQHPRHHQYQ
jgi:hypothetical protein